MPATSQTKQLGTQTRAAKIAPNTFNEKDNTVEVVFATDTPVLRSNWGDSYYEVLSLDAAQIRMTRLNQNAPVLDNHRTWGGVDSQLGKVERAWIEDGVGKAVLRFSSRENVKGIIQDIRDGIIACVSVGYFVHKFTKEEAPTAVGERKNDSIPTYIATDWEPYEISMVSIPADTNAGVRSQSEQPTDVIIITNENRAMPEPIIPTPPVAPAAPAANEGLTEAQRNALAQEAVKAERQRVAEIDLAGRSAALSEEFIQQHREAGTSVDEFRKLAFAELAKRNAPVGKPNGGNPAPESRASGEDPTDRRRDAQQNALLLRGMGVSERDLKPEQVSQAREFRNFRMIDFAKEALTNAGVNYRGWSDMEIFKRALSSSTSDFPILLEGSNRRVLLTAFETASKTWREFCRVGTVGDFREYKRLKKGLITSLDTLAENEQYKNKETKDGVYEKISAKKYGNTLGVTMEMLVNDDLDAMVSLAADLGEAAALTIEKKVYETLLANPVMNEDATTLFHANHGNLIATGGGLDVANLDAMRVLMKNQKDVNKVDFINITPDIGLFPSSLYGKAQVVNNSEFDHTSSASSTMPNSVRGLMRKIIDTPRLTGTAYYLFSSKHLPIEVAFLNGQEAPFMDSQEAFNFDGMQWKIRHVFGVAAVEWRGAVKNAGA